MNPDDPKLTAHAFGELEPAECAQIEQLLRDDPAAVAEVEATRVLAAQLRTRMKGERAVGLHPAQRAELLQIAAAAQSRKVVAFPGKAVAWGALAAGVIVGVSWALMFPMLNRAEKRGAVAHSREVDAAMRDGSQVRVGLAAEPELDSALDAVPFLASTESGFEVKGSRRNAARSSAVLRRGEAPRPLFDMRPSAPPPESFLSNPAQYAIRQTAPGPTESEPDTFAEEHRGVIEQRIVAAPASAVPQKKKRVR